MHAVLLKLALLKPGSIVITLKLPEDFEQWFHIQSQIPVQFSFGRIAAHVLRRHTE
jgi:hypothetical protein